MISTLAWHSLRGKDTEATFDMPDRRSGATGVFFTACFDLPFHPLDTRPWAAQVVCSARSISRFYPVVKLPPLEEVVARAWTREHSGSV